QAARQAKLVEAHLALEKGANRLERGEFGPGVLLLAHGLEAAPEDEAELKGSLRRLLGAWMQPGPAPRLVLPPADAVTELRFSPDGATLFTATLQRSGGNKEARFWDVATGKPTGWAWRREEKDNYIAHVDLSPDFKVLLTHVFHERTWEGEGV